MKLYSAVIDRHYLYLNTRSKINRKNFWICLDLELDGVETEKTGQKLSKSVEEP